MSVQKAEKRGRAKRCLTLDHIGVREGDVPVGHMSVPALHQLLHCQLPAVVAGSKVLEVQSTLSTHSHPRSPHGPANNSLA